MNKYRVVYQDLGTEAIVEADVLSLADQNPRIIVFLTSDSKATHIHYLDPGDYVELITSDNKTDKGNGVA